MRYVLLILLAFGLALPAGAGARPGQADRTFSGDGRVALPDSAFLRGLAVSSAGQAAVLTESGAGFVTRLTRNGRVDPAFGRGGRAAVPVLQAGSGLVVDARGRPVVLGWMPLAGGNSDGTGVVRLTTSGAADAAFGSGGLVHFPAPADGLVAQPVQSPGELGAVVGGGLGSNRLMLARLRGDGREVEQRWISGPDGVDELFPVSLVGPPNGMTVVAVHHQGQRSFIIGPTGTATVAGSVESAVAVGGDVIATHAFFRRDEIGQLIQDRIYLERMTASGAVRWRLAFRGRFSGVGSATIVADGHGGAYAAAPTSKAQGHPILVFHVTRSGRVDPAFGSRGLLVIPSRRPIERVQLALVPSDARLLVAYQNRKALFNDREESGDPRVLVAAFRTT